MVPDTLKVLKAAFLPLFVLAGCGAPGARQVEGAVAAAVEAALAGGTESFTHAEWDRLLADGTAGGLVDYRRMQERRFVLDAYLTRVGGAPLARLQPAHLEALLINAYNAYTVRSILEHPQVASIKDIPGVWTSLRHTVGGFELTLDEIEHRILRPFFRDPRLHMVLNCASMSCAALPPWAIDGERIDAQLEERTRAFLADPRNVRVEKGRLHLSQYFDWYGGDFTAEGWRGAAPTVGTWVAGYAGGEVANLVERHAGRPPIDFVEYDWSLNAAASRPGATEP